MILTPIIRGRVTARLTTTSSKMLMLALTHSYNGRFASQVNDLIAKGMTVYRMYVSGGNYVRCHVCPANFLPPQPELGHLETWGECPGCKTQFIFQSIDKEPS